MPPRSMKKATFLPITSCAKGMWTRVSARPRSSWNGLIRSPSWNTPIWNRMSSWPFPGADGTMLVEGPMQAPFTIRRNIAAVLGLPINRVRVRQMPMGGGFGGKEDSPIDIGCRAAVLAFHTGRPVRMALEREEVTLQTCKRHPMIMEIKIGAKMDGTLMAFQGVIYDEQGAYASLGPIIPPAGGSHIHSMVMMPGPYEIPHVKVDAYLWYTNHPYGGAMRGFGAPQVHIAHEQIMDELARSPGDGPPGDSAEERLQAGFDHGHRPGPGPECRAAGNPGVLRPGLSMGKAISGNRLSGSRKNQAPGCGDRHGLVPDQHRHSPATDAGPMSMFMRTDRLCSSPGITEMGQGSYTVLPQICAEELGIEPKMSAMSSRIPTGRPESGPTVGSRSTTLMGNAIIMAARQVKESILETASELLLVPVTRLEA